MEFNRDVLKTEFREMIGMLCSACAPSGFEGEAAAVVRSFLPRDGYEISTDRLHNLVVHKPGKGPKVAVVAHLDEIGLIIRSVDSHGFCWIETLAGLQPQQLFGKHVIVLTEKGHVDGVVNHVKPGRPAPCTQMPTTLEDFFIDVGAFSREDALAMGVEPGCAVVMDYPTVFLGKDKLTVAGKALDDRACDWQLIELARLLADEPVDADFYAVFSTQEEVGGRGAIVAAQHIRPDYVVALDMSLSTDLPGMAEKQMVNAMRSGVSIKVMDRSRGAACGLIADPDVVRSMKDICREHHIPYQIEAYAAGATDASVMQTRGGGSSAGGIQIPMRYVHSYETAYIPDILDGLELLWRWVRSIR